MIAIFANPGTGAAHYLLGIEARGWLGSDPNGAAAAELCEKDLFHRSAAYSAREATVLHHPAAAHVDAMMGVAASRRNEVRAQGRLVVRGQKSVA